MTLSTKLKDESSRIISCLLVSALETCRHGDVDLAEGLGLSIDTIKKLDRLKAEQINNISENYMRDLRVLDFFCLKADKISKLIDLASDETRLYDMVNEFLMRGACKVMMLELFGMRSTQVANRKKFLSLPTIKGRLPTPTTEEQRLVYDAWLASIKTPDRRERLLYVARNTGLSLSMIYREVKSIEEITNQTDSSKYCA